MKKQIIKTLNKFPKTKELIKLCYDYYKLKLSKKKYKYKTDLDLKSFNGFFGYYDKSPFNLSNDLVLYHQSTTSTKSNPDSYPYIYIILENKNTNEQLLKIKTTAFNWQQGSRTQWISNDKFIFNDFNKEKKTYISRVFSSTQLVELARYDYPVQDSFNDSYFLSINYQRLTTLRPDYGYGGMPGLDNDELRNCHNDGIWKIDYASGKSRLLISLSCVKEFLPNNSMRNAIHKINHIMISPSGDKFIFIHRYYFEGQRFHRLILANSSNGDLKLLSDIGIISHCCWINDLTIFGYMSGDNGKKSYWTLDINSLAKVEFSNGELCSYGDGHPNTNNSLFITDTYPDSSSCQQLILGNHITGDWAVIGDFYHGLSYRNQSRCDLHPRFSHDGEYIFFDSVFDGERKLYYASTPKELLHNLPNI